MILLVACFTLGSSKFALTLVIAIARQAQIHKFSKIISIRIRHRGLEIVIKFRP